MNELSMTEVDEVSGGAIFLVLVVLDFTMAYAGGYAIAKIGQAMKSQIVKNKSIF